MLLQPYNCKRKKQLEELLELQYDILHEYDRELLLADGAGQRIVIKQRLKRELIPRLHDYEKEYAMLLGESIKPDTIPEIEAQSVLDDILAATDKALAIDTSATSNEMIELLNKLHIELTKPGKVAAAKLKTSLPIIPFITKLELELDIENFVTQGWNAVRNTVNSWFLRNGEARGSGQHST